MHPLSTQRLAPVPSANAHHQRALLPPSPLLRLRTNTRSAASARSAPRAISPATPTTASTNDSDTGAQSDKWAEFAARVSGEWDGFGADFTVAGDPVELPANVVPDAYREWGVQVFDWQTQCPTLADPAAPRALHYRLVRLLPTVGCEADAATVHTSHQRHVSSATAFAYHAGGSYVAAWPKGPATVLEVEHCICHPDNAEVRVRLVQTVALAKDEARLRGVKVFSEQRYGPYRNGDQLGGCALRESAFAAGERLAASAVVGQWESTARFSGALDPVTGKFAGLEPDHEPRRTTRDGAGVVTLLPKQLWSSLKVNGDGEEVVCEVGWLLGHGSAVTSTCVLSRDGDVKEIAAAQETRVSEAT